MGLDMYLRVERTLPASHPLAERLHQKVTVPSDGFRWFFPISEWSDDEERRQGHALAADAAIDDFMTSRSLWVDAVHGDDRSVIVGTQALVWRKANAIHRWFVENVQCGEDDCESYKVHLEHLAELAARCSTVLLNPDRAEDILPPQAGFFFGSTEIDDWYFRTLEETKRGIEDLTERFLDFSTDREGLALVYTSSW